MSACGDQPEQGKSIHALHESTKGRVVGQAAVGFASGGDKYDQHRPGYTEETVDLIAKQVQATSDALASAHLKYDVLELGAGTGKLTEQLSKKLPPALNYLATEPSQNFLDVLKSKGLNVDTALATADDLELPDESVGSVVCAQCFHWFAEKKDIESIHRVMAPGGKLILVWNMKRFDQEWLVPFVEQRKKVVARVNGSMKYLVNTGEWRREIDVSPLFELQENHSLAGIEYCGDVEKILSNFVTVSAYNALPDEERLVFVEELRQVLKNWPGLDLNNITMPYSSEMFIYTAKKKCQ